MKKLLAFAFLLIFSYGTFAEPILYIHKQGGLLGGFNKVTQKLKTFDLPGGGSVIGWSVNCKGIGFNGCPASILNPVPPSSMDATDVNKSINLWDHAIDRIENHNDLSGSHAIQVQVAGETFTRVYTVVWSSISQDSDEDCTIEIDRTDI